MNFSILSPETPIIGKFFLEASAGTGKTFSIEHLIPRLLLESPHPLSIEKILVVTFTRAATRELSSRIYRNLLEVKQALEEKKILFPYLRPMVEEGHKTIKLALWKIEEALVSFEKAQIFTLHGFCLQALQHLVLETLFLPPEKETYSRKEILYPIIEDFLRKPIPPSLLSSSQIAKVCTYTGKQTRSLSEAILDILEKEHAPYPYPSTQELCFVWNQHIEMLPRISQEALWESFALVYPRRKKESVKGKQALLFFQCIEKGVCEDSSIELLCAEKTFFLDAPSEKKTAAPHFHLLNKIYEIFYPLYQQYTDPKISLLKLATSCKESYEQGKQCLSYVAPKDFILQTKKALQDPIARQKIQNRYQALIIDEFQDTDQDQWDIFSSTFFSSPSMQSIFLVGDPKQSIYSFRNADLNIYLQAAKLFPPSHHLYLTKNFRSHPDLLQQLNTLFCSKACPGFLYIPSQNSSLVIHPAEAHPQEHSIFSSHEPRLEFFLFTNEELGMLFMAKEILHLHQNKNIPLQDIAILVKDRYQAEEIQSLLKKQGIASQLEGSCSTTKLAYEVMLDLVMLVQSPLDKKIARKLLAGPLWGYTEQRLSSVVLTDLQTHFLVLQKKSLTKGWGALWYDILQLPSQETGKSLEQELLEREDDSLYFAMRQVLQLVLDENKPSLLSLQTLLLTILQDPHYTPKTPPLLEKKEEQVQLLTLHKSKGLEFPIVFAAGLFRRHKGKEEFLPCKKQEKTFLFSAQEHSLEYRLFSQEKDAEKMRQLYVALTRAKEKLYVPFLCYEEPPSYGGAAPIELLVASFFLSTFSVEALYAQLPLSIEKIEPQLKDSFSYQIITQTPLLATLPSIEVMPPPRPDSLLFPPEFLLSFSSLTKEKSRPFLQSTLEHLLFPPGAQTGLIFHSLLEFYCQKNKHRSAEKLHLKTCELTKTTPLEGLETALIEHILQTMQTPIPTPYGTLYLGNIDCSEMQTEVEFFYQEKPHRYKGFIDLILRFQGRYFIIDWKTNALASYTQDSLQKCMEEQEYYLQAALYTRAIEKMIGAYENESFSSCFGGVIYFFLRGQTALYLSATDVLPILEEEVLFHKTPYAENILPDHTV